ncbi:hypothetical protein CFC21_026662 [Triticum aestivum]|uniref:DUF4220 domain-containing protein n=2 Tax=Triticum aestivum TaxID=4565 RepID=A0A9R1JCI4_WHEAT|nr:hypothetical protein CFC21_026662 [Triticum aestivum]
MHPTESLIKLFSEWEIQLLVLLSFTLQLFLFFTGSLRRNGTSGFLRLSIWAAYLGADLVAVYALGLLSRHEDITTTEWHMQLLAFFWAPFLLIHLGGQDTITAFAMEDNNLWLRHLLNLVVQVLLALYVFWKSIGRHNVELLVSGIFVFVAGVVKYGERTWSLRCGSLESSTGHHYIKLFPEEINVVDAGYSSIVCAALDSMPYILGIFSASSLFATSPLSEDTLRDPDKMLKVVRLELGMMYDDLYTKAVVLRTRSVIILRCISQISFFVSFALFHADDKRRYSRGDTAITYTLFFGGFLLEVCAMFVFMMSPWTWAWLKVKKCNRLAKLSWFIFSTNIGWPEKNQRWPNLMGQYNFRSWLSGNDLQPRTCKQRVMAVVKRLFMYLFCAEKKNIFWMSKLLDTEYVNVDKMMMECVAKEICLLHDEFPIGDSPTKQPPHKKGRREWQSIQPLLTRTETDLVTDFGCGISEMHMLTELHLSKYPPPSDMEANNAGMVEVCRKLSHYMMYLLVTHPSMLPLNISAEATLERYQVDPRVIEQDLMAKEEGKEPSKEVLERMEPSKEALEGLVHMWTRLLLYAAGKSRVEMHKTQLSRGGELITFAWLFMAHYGLGDSQLRRIQITNDETKTVCPSVPQIYAFYDPNYSTGSDESSCSQDADVPSSPSECRHAEDAVEPLRTSSSSQHANVSSGSSACHASSSQESVCRAVKPVAPPTYLLEINDR